MFTKLEIKNQNIQEPTRNSFKIKINFNGGCKKALFTEFFVKDSDVVLDIANSLLKIKCAGWLIKDDFENSDINDLLKEAIIHDIFDLQLEDGDDIYFENFHDVIINWYNDLGQCMEVSLK